MMENLESIISISKIGTAIRRTLSKKIVQYSFAVLATAFAFGLTFAPSSAHAPPSWPRWADRDKDRYPAWRDCDDRNASVYPGASEECNGIDDDCDRAIDEGFDVDGDGYTSCASPVADCNDRDASINPNAEEICDNVDNNCNEIVDGGFDWDSDGYTICAEPTPDCDDNEWSVYPGADEYCDSADNDCDEIVDNNPVDPETWYADNDGDLFGNLYETALACECPEGYVEDDTDCDDADEEIYPGAIELCDLLDNDCDGEVDEGLQCIGKITFISNRTGNYEVWTMNDDGTNLQQITDYATGSSSYDGADSPRWSPDGTKIAFYYGNYAGDYGPGSVNVVHSDSSNFRVLYLGNIVPIQISWTPDGSSLIFIDVPTSCNDYADLIDVSTTSITEFFDGEEDGSYPNPTFIDLNPDASQFVYIPYACGGSYGGVRVRNYDSSNPQTLNSDADFEQRWTKWSDAGNRIAYLKRPTREDGFQINIMNADGSGEYEVPIPTSVDEMGFDWARNDEFIIYSSERNLYLYNLNTSELEQLTYESYDSAPDWISYE